MVTIVITKFIQVVDSHFNHDSLPIGPFDLIVCLTHVEFEQKKTFLFPSSSKKKVGNLCGNNGIIRNKPAWDKGRLMY